MADELADPDATAEEWPDATAPYDEGGGLRKQLHDDDDENPTPYEPDDSDEGEAILAKWRAVGATLTAARQTLGLSKREAARRAGLSDGAWRHLEAGMKIVYGKEVIPNPRPENLISAARAVNLRPEKLLLLAGMEVPRGELTPASDDELATEIRALNPADRQLVQDLIYRLSK